MRDPLERRGFIKAVGLGSVAAAMGAGGAFAAPEGPGPAGPPPAQDGKNVESTTAAAEFPYRPLMEPVYDHSMMKRYLEKEVHESVVLDDMESDRGWRITEGRGELSYTAEIARTGTRSMQLRIPMRDEEYLRAHSQNGSLTSYAANVAAQLSFATPLTGWYE